MTQNEVELKIKEAIQSQQPVWLGVWIDIAGDYPVWLTLGNKPAQPAPAAAQPAPANWAPDEKTIWVTGDTSWDEVIAMAEAAQPAQPAQRKPLTIEWITACIVEAGQITEPMSDYDAVEWIVRKVEAAQGIGGEA